MNTYDGPFVVDWSPINVSDPVESGWRQPKDFVLAIWLGRATWLIAGREVNDAAEHGTFLCY
jgi:hypothetical protein